MSHRQERVQVARAAATHLDQKIIFTSDVMALADLFQVLHALEKRLPVVRLLERHPDKRRQTEARCFRIDNGRITANNASLFQFSRTFGRRRG